MKIKFMGCYAYLLTIQHLFDTILYSLCCLEKLTFGMAKTLKEFNSF